MVDKHLDIGDFMRVWAKMPGLIPVSIQKGKVVWKDVGRYHFYEGFFHKSLNTLSLLTNVPEYTTDLSILLNSSLSKEGIQPTGFIFHAGRCGSTLLAKVLASSRNNHLISEAEPLNKIFFHFTNDGSKKFELDDEKVLMYKNLLLALSRKRVETHSRCFVKFSSYNIHFFNFINKAFPLVPKIFISRDTDEIVASFQKKPAAWMHEENYSVVKEVFKLQGSDIKGIVEGFKLEAEGLNRLDYKELTQTNIKRVCNYFDYVPNEMDLSRMQKQFSYDSKIEFNKKQFER